MTNRIIRVKVFDFKNKDSNHSKMFDRKDIERFLSNPNTIKNLKFGRYNSLVSHKSRITDRDIVGNDIFSYISTKDYPLINKDIAGIIKSIFIKADEVFADIVLLKNEYGEFIKSLIDGGVKIGVSISFINDSDITEDHYSIYELNGIDFTLDPAFTSSEITGVYK